MNYFRSPLNSAVMSTNSSSAVINSIMDVPQSVPSNSSDSSDSGDSDSDESSSDSNDSDSSASSEASDADTPSKVRIFLKKKKKNSEFRCLQENILCKRVHNLK